MSLVLIHISKAKDEVKYLESRVAVTMSSLDKSATTSPQDALGGRTARKGILSDYLA
jgi:hypothetical protein